MQQYAKAAFDTLISRYPHSRLQYLEQSDLAIGDGTDIIKVFRDLHDLRWAMSNLSHKADGRSDFKEGDMIGGVDRALLDRLIARLALKAAPQTAQKIKDGLKKQLGDPNSFEDYWLYLDMLRYAGQGDAAATANVVQPEWSELGFENRVKWVKLLQNGENHLQKQKNAYAAKTRQLCDKNSLPVRPA